jgi:uncharacterized protein YndB with AHSA1/START domain
MSADITATVRIAATPDVVFGYFIEPELIVKWIGEWADLTPTPDGVFALNFERTAVRGRYVSVEPPHRVVFTWGVPGDEAMPPGSSTVEITLTPDGDETIVNLVHRGLPEDKRESHLQGWLECLARLGEASAAGIRRP